MPGRSGRRPRPCLLSLLEKAPLACTRPYIILSFMTRKDGISRKKELNVGAWGCGASAAMTLAKMMTSEAYSPSPSLVWTVTGPLELFSKELDMESVPLAVISRASPWAGKEEAGGSERLEMFSSGER